MRHVPSAAILSIALAAWTAAAAEAATIRVPQQHATIQGAVDAAAPGDRIDVARGLYRENIVVPAGKDGLSIRGRGAVVDGTIGDVRGAAITVRAPGVTVEALTFRNGEAAVSIHADDVTVRRCTQQATRANFIEAYGAARTRVESNRVRGYQLVGASGDGVVVRGNRMLHSDDVAVNVDGNGTVVERNVIRSTWETAIDLTGAAVQVRRNTVQVTSGYGINCWNRLGDAEGGVVEGNVLRTIFGDAIRLVGRGFRVEGNTVAGCEGYAVNVQGNGATILRNTVSDVRSGGIWLRSGTPSSATGATVEENVLTMCMGEPFFLEVTGASIRRNRSVESGQRYRDAFTVRGDGNAVERNTVSDVGGHGFFVDGAANVLTKCTVTGGASSGFWISAGAGNRLDGCIASNCAEYGVANFAAGTEIRNCTFLASGLADVTNDSGAPYAAFERVKHATGGNDERALWHSGDLVN